MAPWAAATSVAASGLRAHTEVSVVSGPAARTRACMVRAQGPAPTRPTRTGGWTGRGRCAWPHDNAVIALGLARYGLDDALHTLPGALAETAAHHAGRLPGVLAGYSRTEHPRPVPYPHACSPQAWAAATPLALLASLQGRISCPSS